MTFGSRSVQGLVVRRPKRAHRAEVGIYPTTCQLHLRPAQGITRVEIPQAHHSRVPKAVWVAVGHVDTILMLAHEHDLVYGHFLSVGHPGPFGQLFEGSSHLSVKFGGVTALQPQHLSIGGNAKNTFLDDRSASMILLHR